MPLPSSLIYHLRSRAMLTVLLAVFFNSAFASSSTMQAFNIEEIAPGIHVHKGQHASFESEAHDDVANIGFILGDTCVAVIDSGGSVRTATALLARIQSKTSKPVCYVVNTHIHFDHLLGNRVFANSGAKFVGHANLEDEIAANRAFFLEQYAADLGPGADETAIIAPDILVEDTLQLDLGNRILTLTAHGAAHTHTDLSIFDEQSKTLWLSDLLFMERIPALDGSLRGWIKTLQQLRQIPAARIVPGHGPVSADPADAYAEQDAYLRLLLDETRAGINQGKFMEDIVEELGAQEKLRWLLHEQHHRRNVTRAFSELEWE